jgi:hypothetical protein
MLAEDCLSAFPIWDRETVHHEKKFRSNYHGSPPNAGSPEEGQGGEGDSRWTFVVAGSRAGG